MVKKLLLWLWMLTKRLYKKPTFLVILLLIPVLVLSYNASAQKDSGVITIALYAEEDPLAAEIMDKLEEESQLIQYKRCDSRAEAKLLVQTGKVDAAWILSDNLQAHIDTFVKSPDSTNAFLSVIQREENVAMMLSREKLSGTIYIYLARSFYVDYVRKTFPDLAHLSDDELLAYYDGVDMTDNLFAYDEDTIAATQDVNYLTAPIRGLLAVIVVLGSMATAMYFIRDMKNGTFQWLPQRLAPLPELGCQLVSAWNICFVALLTLILCRLAKNLLLELLILLLYGLCCGAFAMLLRRLLPSIPAIGTLIPLLIVAMLIICPVFFDLGKLRLVQLLFPPTYYVNAAYNPLYILYMVVHTLLCGLLYLLIGKIRKHS